MRLDNQSILEKKPPESFQSKAIGTMVFLVKTIQAVIKNEKGVGSIDFSLTKAFELKASPLGSI